MELSDLNVFLAVARERSFSRAAEKLYRTQPAVSQALRRLETWAGERLLERKARGILLTDAGEVLVEYAERMLNLRAEVKKSLADLTGLRRGKLSLGVNESSIHALLPVLARYRKKYPQVHIGIQRTFSRDIPREVLNHRIDFGVISFEPQDEKLTAVKIFRDELAFVVPPRHRLARRKSVSVKEASAEPFVAHIVESPFRWRVIRLFEKQRVPLHMPVELPTIESIKRFVQMGMGVAIVPRMCVEHELKQGALVEVKIRQMRMPRDLYLVHRSDARLSHAAQALYKMLRAGSE